MKLFEIKTELSQEKDLITYLIDTLHMFVKILSLTVLVCQILSNVIQYCQILSNVVK